MFLQRQSEKKKRYFLGGGARWAEGVVSEFLQKSKSDKKNGAGAGGWRGGSLGGRGLVNF